MVTHELTHAALAPLTSGRTPAWLTEGVAMYVSGDAAPPRPRSSPRLRVPTLRRAERAGRDRPARRATRSGAAYAYASAAAFCIADRYGRGAAARALRRLQPAATCAGRAGDPALTDAAVRRVLGAAEPLERDLRDAP